MLPKMKPADVAISGGKPFSTHFEAALKAAPSAVRDYYQTTLQAQTQGKEKAPDNPSDKKNKQTIEKDSPEKPASHVPAVASTESAPVTTVIPIALQYFNLDAAALNADSAFKGYTVVKDAVVQWIQSGMPDHYFANVKGLGLQIEITKVNGKMSLTLYANDQLKQQLQDHQKELAAWLTNRQIAVDGIQIQNFSASPFHDQGQPNRPKWLSPENEAEEGSEQFAAYYDRIQKRSE